MPSKKPPVCAATTAGLALLALLSTSNGFAAAKPVLDFYDYPVPPVYDTRTGPDREYLPGITVFDVNADELPDIFIGQGKGKNDLLMLQDPEQRWIVTPLDSKNTEATHAALAVDLNRDFRPDLVVARRSGTWVYLNQAEGGFRKAMRLPTPGRRLGEATTMAIVAADLNGDGWLDIVETRRDGSAGDGDRLWINQGELDHGRPVFREEATARGADLCCASAGVATLDIDGDTDLDLIVVGQGSELTVLSNNGDGHFSASSLEFTAGDWRGVVTGDMDNDGHVDVLVSGTAADSDHSSVRLLKGLEGGGFRDVTEKTGISVPGVVSNASMMDLDADGWLDIAIAAAAPAGLLETPVHYLHNNRHKRRFVNVSEDVDLDGFVPLSILPADLNRDGRPDQFMLGDGGKVKVLLNTVKRTNWLSVNLRGRNDRAIAGTRVVLRMQDGTRLTRYYKHGEGLAADTDDLLVFSFGRRSEITVLEINWPSGNYTRVDGPDINRHIGFVEPSDENKTDISMKYPMFGLVEAQNKRMRENPEVREQLLRPAPRRMCR